MPCRFLRVAACALAIVHGNVLAGSILRFETLTIRDGLAQNSVTAITQDATGYLWFGSQDGLNRHDGRRFTIFKNDPNDRLSIPANYISALLPGQNGDIWVGTRFAGVARFDAATETFERIPLLYDSGARDARFIAHRIVRHDGQLWVATNRGLAQLDTEARALRLVPLPGAQAFPDVRALHARNGRLWIGSTGRVLEMTADGVRVTRLPDRNLVAQALLLDGETLLIGTNRGVFGSTATDVSRIEALPAAAFMTLNRDPENGIWAGGREGVFHRQAAGDEWRHYAHDDSNPASIGQDVVFDIFTDSDEVMWIGTYGGGLSRAVLSQRRFGLQQQQAGRLTSNIVFPIHEDPDGIVWIGTYNDGLVRWDRERDQWRSFRHDATDPRSLPDNEVRSLLTDANGSLWVGTHGGLARLDADGFTRFRHDPDDSTSLAHDAVTALFIDSRERFWVGTWGGGLDLFDPDSGTFRHFPPEPGKPGALSGGMISRIIEAPTGELWIATSGGGLNRLDPQTGSFHAFRHVDDDPASLANDAVSTLWLAGTHLWIGTANGLDRMNIATGEIRHYRERDGLSNNLVLGILGDDEGRLWISTNRGLSRFDPATEEFHTFVAADGLQSDEYNSFAYFRNARGELYFGGIDGFNVFDPARVRRDTEAPAVRIAGLTLFNRPVSPEPGNPDALLKGPVDRVESITLDHDQKLFAIEFAALSYLDPKRNRFAYRLRGFSDNWVETGADMPFATFTNLDPGDYLFEVRAANADGIWSAQAATLGITVLPPLWRTPLAYFAYGLFLAAIAWLLLQYLQKRLEVRFLAGEKHAAEEATRLKSSFLALMSHEIRTPMNGVLGMVQLLSRTRLSRRQRGYVEALEKSGESLLSILDDVLDFSRIEADVLEFENIPFNPGEVAESVVLLLGPRAREKRLALGFHPDQPLPTVHGDPNRLRQVLMNLVSNAIKFTPAGGIKVRATEQRQGAQTRITFAVEDTGIGISETQKLHLFDAFTQADSSTRRTYGGTGLGLSICKRLIEMQGGHIGVESAPNAGSVFWFELDFDIADEPPRVESAPERKGRVLRVLLVEDEPVNQVVARGLLEHERHAVSVAPDGLTALRLISEREFDVVLMDIHMPGMDGRETTRRIRSLDDPVRSNIPILGLTASISADDVSGCLNAGMNKVLRKPLMASRLMQALAQLDDEDETPQREELALVDTVMLVQHRSALGDDRFRDILATFRQTSAMLVDAIEAAALGGDEMALRRDAHRLAGAAGTMGCRKLAAVAAQVEQGNTESDALRSIYRQTEHALQAMEKMETASGTQET